jgi:hypothetical protein
MDLRRYYQKIREVESTIVDRFAVVVSLETPDGGKGGALTEVLPRVAAKMVVDGVAKLASTEETQRLREAQAEAQRAAEQAATMSRVQLTVLPTTELNRLREAASTQRD